MAEPLFSDGQKTALAQHKVLYEHNLLAAKLYAQCSLQAAVALLEILQIFADAVERIRNQKELTEFQHRLYLNTRIEVEFKSTGTNAKKVELNEKLAQLTQKTKGTVTRLRKSMSK